MVVGKGMRAAIRDLLNFFQSMSLKFLGGQLLAWGSCSSRVMRMGTWSVQEPWWVGSVKQWVREPIVVSVQKKLSGWVQFLVAEASKVGLSFSSAMTIP